MQNFVARYRKRTLARDLIIGLIMALVAVITVQSIIYYITSAKTAEKRLDVLADSISNEFAKVIVLPMWNMDYTMMRQISAAYLNSESLIAIRVKTKVLDPPIYDNFPPNPSTLIYRKKIVKRRSLKIGSVELLFTNLKIIKAQQTLIKSIITISLTVIFMIFAGTHLIMRFLLNKPIERFIKGIRSIAQGDYQHPLSPVPQQDINAIINEVNAMLYQISTRTEQLQNEVSERKKAEKKLAETQALLTAAIEQSSSGIIVADAPNVRVRIANSAAFHIWGERKSEKNAVDIGQRSKNWVTFYPDGRICRQRDLPISRAISYGEVSQNVELIIRKMSGDQGWVSANAAPIRNEAGDIMAGIVIFNDITKRKTAEKALRTANDELEKRVQDRTLELEKANDELQKAKEAAEAATHAKSDFLANMSHEIRTPLNGVIAAADLVKNEDCSPQVERYFNIIYSSAYTLLGLINDILDFSKIEAGKMELEIQPFELEQVISNVVEIVCGKIRHGNVELLVDIKNDTPRLLIGDPLRVQQILANLISNAIKFTEEGIIVLGVRWEEKTSDQVLLKFFIRDTGLGIEPDRLARLFDPFTQADASTTRKYGGTGLGLSICKLLVDLMGGEISAKSEPGRGSTFFFTVKFGYQQCDDVSLDLPEGLKGTSVLLVDDCHESRIVMKNQLESFGHVVKTAAFGEDAIRILKQQKTAKPEFKWILMDWLMPNMDGIHVAYKIRNDMNLDIPIIMMTAFGSENEKQYAQKAGINAFLHKPVSPSLLFETIMDIFGMDAWKGKSRKTDKESIPFKSDNVYKGLKILLAEDNATNREIMVAILKSTGAVLDIVKNGIEAVEAVEKSSYDCILMDIQMPKMDGYEATRIIKNRPGFKNIPIIAMTAHALKGDKTKCLDAGMDGYVSKPINQKMLFYVMNRFIRSSMPENDSGKSSISSPLLMDLPGIDVKEVLERMCMSETDFHEILIRFCKDNFNTVSKIDKALEYKKWEWLKAFMHKLKGSSGNIGASKLYAAAADLETSILKGAVETQTVQSQIEGVKEALTLVLSVLDHLEDHSSAPRPSDDLDPPGDLDLPGSMLTPDEMKSVFKDMFATLEKSDPVDIEKQTDKFARRINHPDMDRLVSCISDYEYEKAVKIIEQMSVDNNL
ncbi:response regulator [Desulfobacterales bacterium HSG16]|nr:response regulator [Desulfobacterales bacterium HSG16]